MSLTVPLSVSVRVTLDGSGNGQVQIGPTLAGTSWIPPLSVGVLVAPVSTSVVSQFQLFNGAPQATNFIGGTYTGDNNSAVVGIPLELGMVLTGVWSGGNPGATATMTVSGMQQIPGPPG